MPEKLSEYMVRLAQSGKQFPSISNVSVLESGLSAGLSLPYGCANGSCGDCKARIISGQVYKIRFHDYPLTENEKATNVCLLCSYAAESDLLIEVTEASSVEDIPFQQTRGKLCHLEQIQEYFVARFKLTRGKALRYLPGQSAELTFPDKQKKKYPIANCPCESSYLEFHIPLSDQLPLNTLRPLDRITIEGPYGNFTLSSLRQTQNDPSIQKPALLIAGATGFSSVKPLVEHLLSLEEEIPCALIWIAESSETTYRHNLCRSWADAFEQFTYLPVNNRESAIEALTELWLKHLPQSEIYISGNTSDIKHCIDRLTVKGVKADLLTTNTV